MSEALGRTGRAHVWDGTQGAVGVATVIGRTVHIKGHRDSDGRPVDRSYVNRGVVVDWLDEAEVEAEQGV
jgi:hypothetical protein